MRRFTKIKKKSISSHIIRAPHKKIHLQKAERRTALRLFIIIVVLFTTCIFLTWKFSNELYYYFLFSISFFNIAVSLFRYEIKNSIVLQQFKVWISVLIFILYGFIISTESIVLNIIGTLMILFTLYRNSRAFYESVKWAEVKQNLTIALANIFQIIIAYGVLYKLTYIYIPNSFHVLLTEHSEIEIFLDFIYFSFITFTTLGYGDITPIHFIARILVITEISLFLSLVTISIIFVTNHNKKNNNTLKRK